MKYLEQIHSPGDLQKMDPAQLEELATEIREKILSCVSETEGHLASNLGMVEATIALHRAFDSPQDAILFDVGHQAYAHKLLTGRYESFDTIRQYGGISGFTNREESEHDVLTAGAQRAAHCLPRWGLPVQRLWRDPTDTQWLLWETAPSQTAWYMKPSIAVLTKGFG